jgi:cytochrome c oxidase subunit 2
MPSFLILLYFKFFCYLLTKCWQVVGLNVEAGEILCAWKKKDAPLPYQLSFQDPATPNMSGVIDLHHEIMFFLVIIVTFVLWMLVRTVILFKTQSKFPAEGTTESVDLEICWTILPAVILFCISGPSFALLYATDELIQPEFVLKVVGHQWYWSYQYVDALPGFIEKNDACTLRSFDSVMIQEEDLLIGRLRLLEVTARVYLPTRTHINILVTAADVLHSWAVPSLGVKVDACPGRLNRVSIYIRREGIFYGQCSELCGILHGFMPIVVEAIDIDSYLSYRVLLGINDLKVKD